MTISTRRSKPTGKPNRFGFVNYGGSKEEPSKNADSRRPVLDNGRPRQSGEG